MFEVPETDSPWTLLWEHVGIFAAITGAALAVNAVGKWVVARLVPRSRHLGSHCLLLLGAALAGPVALEGGENLPSFQNGGSVSLLEDCVPLEWSPVHGIAWTASVPGHGQSSPVVWDGQVYVTSVSGPNKETYHVTAFRLRDGVRVWQHDLANAQPEEDNGYVSRAAPTPAADADGVVCFFEGGNLLALSHEGGVRWERNLVDDYGSIDARHGLAASVEQNADSAFIWVERAAEPYVLCVDKATGATRWKVDGLRTTSWASPRLIDVGEGRHLVLSGIGRLTGLDPQTGRPLWTFDGISGNSTPTPVPVGRGRFLIGATVGRGQGDSRRAAESNGLIELWRGADGRWRAGYVWRAERATCSFGSPIAHRGLAYFVNASGVVYALDLESGEEVFAERIGDSVWATPIAAGDHVLFFAKGGRTTAIAAGTTFRKIATNDCWETSESAGTTATAPVLYAAAVCGNRLLLRRGDSIACVAAPN